MFRSGAEQADGQPVITSSVDLVVSRVMAAVCIVTLSVFAVAVPLLAPQDYDPFWLRSPILFGSVWLLVGSFSMPYVRRNARRIAVAIGFMAEAWVLILGALNEMHIFRVMSIYVVATLVPLTFRELREVVGFTVGTLVGLVVAYQYVEQPSLPLWMAIPLLGATLMGIGAVNLWRARLQDEVERSRDLLEDRIAERTEALRQEVEERRRAELLAQQANRAKSAFLANMSHELRTPLNAIQGYVELVTEELDDRGQDDLVDDLSHARAAASHLLEIIDHLLDLSRIEAGKLDLRMEEVDLDELVEEATNSVRHALLERGNTLEVDVRVQELVTDGARLRQVLVNLLSNAAKFTTDSTVSVRVYPDGHQVVLTVADTGCGIPEEALPTLFDKFTQVDDSSTRRQGGTGLGLAITRELVHLMGGRIEVVTAMGAGSCFVVRLPTRAAWAAGGPRSAASGATHGTPGRGWLTGSK